MSGSKTDQVAREKNQVPTYLLERTAKLKTAVLEGVEGCTDTKYCVKENDFDESDTD